MARTFDFVRATNDVITGPGIQVPLAGQSTTSAETHYDKGWAVQKSVFGKMIDELYEQSPKDRLHIERFLSAKVAAISTRRGLDIKIRKLVTLSILLAMGGLDAQVKGHMEATSILATAERRCRTSLHNCCRGLDIPALKALNEVTPAR